METYAFWAFFVIALFVGLTFGFVFTNIAIVGLAVSKTTSDVGVSETTIPVPWWQRIFIQTTPIVKKVIDCRDSDGGLNFEVKGTCMDVSGSHTDSCYSNYTNESILREWYCVQNSYCVNTEYNCLAYGYGGCQNGACIRNWTDATIQKQESSIQTISLTEIYERFIENMPESLQLKITQLRLPYPPYPIGCIDYEDMEGEWEVFMDSQGYWRARYLGPFPTKIKPYYVVNISGVGSPVEAWPEVLPGDIVLGIDSCGRQSATGYPTCHLVEAYCSSPTNVMNSHIFCTGNCTGDFSNGAWGCDPAGFAASLAYDGGKCNYPWRRDFGNYTYENPLIS